MPNAICLKCGTAKRQPWKLCQECGFDPTLQESAHVKSVYLSIGRFEDDDARDRYSVELAKIGKAIGRGESVEFDEDELERLLQQKQDAESVTVFDVVSIIFHLFLPIVAFLVSMWGLLLLARWLFP